MPTGTSRLIQRIRLDVPVGNPPGDYEVRVAWVGKNKGNDYQPRLDSAGRFAGIWSVAGRVSMTPAVLTGDDLDSVPLPPDAPQIIPGVYAAGVPTLPAEIGQGERLQFSVTWRAQAAPAAGIQLRLVLEPSPASGATQQPVQLWQGHPVRGSYPFERWQAGEVVIDRYDVPIPADLPPGIYRLRLVAVPEVAEDTASMVGAPAFDVPLQVRLVERRFDVPVLATMRTYVFGDGILLRGYDVTQDGASLTVRLVWQATTTPDAVPDADYTMFVHVVAPDGRILTQQDRPPYRATRQWIAGEVIEETVTLTLPAEATQSTQFEVRVGLYLQDNGARLPVRSDTQPADDVAADYVVLR